MHSDTLKRLFRAIGNRSWTDVSQISQLIISEEKKKGHVQLAKQLQGILAHAHVPSDSQGEITKKIGTLSELPRNRRNNQVLVSKVSTERLRHHMVLRSDIDSRLVRIEREFAASDRLSRFGLRNKQKILLFGPPGCGKTLAAERLAFRLGLPLLKTRFDSVMSSLFGESASNLRQVFEAAEENPCVLLLDECDFVARSRLQQNDVGEAPRIVNTFLQMLDDYSGRGLIVATTNLHTTLDAAVFRRFDESIEMPLPETGQVEHLLRATLSAIEVSPAVNWQELEEHLLGQSAAIVVRIAQEAAKECVLSGGRVIEQKDFARALATLSRAP